MLGAFLSDLLPLLFSIVQTSADRGLWKSRLLILERFVYGGATYRQFLELYKIKVIGTICSLFVLCLPEEKMSISVTFILKNTPFTFGFSSFFTTLLSAYSFVILSLL